MDEKITNEKSSFVRSGASYFVRLGPCSFRHDWRCTSLRHEMKPSHYQTPRTLSECSFEVGHSRFEDDVYSGKASNAPLWVFAAALAAFLLMVWQ